MQKYKLTNNTLEFQGRVLYRIQSVRDFGGVKKGELGGWIEKEENLSHEGNCWVFDNAKVYDNAVVSGNAIVCNNARVFMEALVFHSAVISRSATVLGKAQVFQKAIVFGKASIFGKAFVYGEAQVCDFAKVYGEAKVCGKSKIEGNVVLHESRVYGKSEFELEINHETTQNIAVIKSHKGNHKPKVGEWFMVYSPIEKTWVGPYVIIEFDDKDEVYDIQKRKIIDFYMIENNKFKLFEGTIEVKENS